MWVIPLFTRVFYVAVFFLEGPFFKFAVAKKKSIHRDLLQRRRSPSDQVKPQGPSLPLGWCESSQEFVECLGSPPPPFISHKKVIWKGSHNPIVRGRNRSPRLLTTYPSPGSPSSKVVGGDQFSPKGDFVQLMVNCWFGLLVWDSGGTPK